MKLKTKANIANISIWVILITIIVITLFFFGFILTETFDLKVFTNRTSDFIWTLFGASLVIVICGAFLNISLNIGIIADKKIDDIDFKSTSKSNNKKIVQTVVIALLLITALMFTGDFLTRQKEKNKLVELCQKTINHYDNSINNISLALTDTTKIEDIPDILKFLGEQKSEFPNIILITSGDYNGQLAYLKITPYMSKKDLKKDLFNFSLYSCNKYDSDYIEEIFTTDKSDYFFWTEKNNYKLYYPIVSGDQKYILLFSKYDRYGKIGS